MSDRQSKSQSRASKVVKASPDEAYQAFVDPRILVDWLPPAEMTGTIHDFRATVGGGYRMSLFYPESETFQGKTTEKEDRVQVRFVELDPPHRIVEAVRFVSDDPAFSGVMTMTVTLEPVDGGTEVTLAFRDLPPGLKPEDNDEGAQMSLDQLARRFE